MEKIGERKFLQELRGDKVSLLVAFIFLLQMKQLLYWHWSI